MFSKGLLNEGGNYCSDLNAHPKQVKRIPLRWIVQCGDESRAKNCCLCDEQPASDQINNHCIPFENNFFFFSLKKVTACGIALK